MCAEGPPAGANGSLPLASAFIYPPQRKQEEPVRQIHIRQRRVLICVLLIWLALGCSDNFLSLRNAK